MRRDVLAVVFAIVACCIVVAAEPAGAATCSQYPNQAAAQRAADTRDADGDGIYCESLPCPCLRPGEGTSTIRTTRPTPRPVGLGRPVLMGRRTKSTGCRVRGALPDPSCTPGAYYPNATRSRICRPGYASQVRYVPQATKTRVYFAYGMRRRFDGRDGEVDHLVSLELGGSNSVANLFPEAASPWPGSHEKDKLENELHSEVCAGRISLRGAQRLVARNWVAAYRARFAR
jgi:hypothetical protein